MNLQGNPIDYLVVFFAGFLASFNPCVYPLLPITISFIGVDSSANKLRGFILSLFYVSGIALVYAILGLIAALSGSIFGMVSAHPLTRIIVGVVFIFFGLSLWGLFPLRVMGIGPGLPTSRKGLLGIFFLGVNSGLVIGSCTSPVLGAILILVASRQNIFYGATLLLTFAYGMGAIIILAGTFSRFLLRLPKSGTWMNKINIISGSILIGIGLFFIFIAITGG